MIEYLRGKLVAFSSGQAILEVGSVGLSLEVPEAAGGLERMVGSEVLFYTRLIYREDDLRLIGFLNAAERDLFKLVTAVSGFGPRLGLALLGSLTVPQLCAAILEEDSDTLCQAPGVGKKMAQRLILELKEKVSRLYTPAQLALVGQESPRSEIIEALRGLGYSRAEATAAVKKVTAGGEGALAGEELLKRALNLLAGGSRPGR